MREVKAGRGSPHGGVFLDIAWIKEKLPNAPEHIKRKLPSMYHQFKQLADLDITTTPMEVGPTTHYIMGGIWVDAETQMSTVPGLFAAGECGRGLHGANRLGGNSLSDLLVFGKRAGRYAAEFAKQHSLGSINTDLVDSVARWSLEPFDRGAKRPQNGEGPYRIQHELQGTMQDLVGIVRNEGEMLRALETIQTLKNRARNVVVDGNREYNTGWHTALDLWNLLTISEAIARSAIERKESRGGHFREDYPDKDKAFGQVNIMVRRGPGGEMQIRRERIAEMPAELKRIVEEQQK
jgi:succinate dehydrogenase / fumarate reductase flavoprotein subunit